jgi:hypothetical protein
MILVTEIAFLLFQGVLGGSEVCIDVLRFAWLHVVVSVHCQFLTTEIPLDLHSAKDSHGGLGSYVFQDKTNVFHTTNRTNVSNLMFEEVCVEYNLTRRVLIARMFSGPFDGVNQMRSQVFLQ